MGWNNEDFDSYWARELFLNKKLLLNHIKDEDMMAHSLSKVTAALMLAYNKRRVGLWADADVYQYM